MTATRINHVSVHADDLDRSEAFYRDLFGMERIPTPYFRHPVRWLRIGEMQLHLFNRAAIPPANHHFALSVSDPEDVYRQAKELGILEAPTVNRLPDGSVQFYLRDPSGNLVEINAPDADRLDPSLVGELHPIGGEPGAKLFL